MNKFTKGIKKHGISILFAAPFIILFFVFIVIPVLISVFYSLTEYDILQPARFVGLENYLFLFLEDEVFMTALKNTLLFSIIYVPLSMLASLFIAWLINEFSDKVRTFLVCIFYAPSISGGTMVIWNLILSGDSYGLLNQVLMDLNIISSPAQWLIDPKYMFTILVIVSLWGSLGLGFLTYVAAFKGIDPELYEAAAMDGVKNRVQELWYITLPTLKPQLAFSAINAITGGFGVGGVSSQLFGAISTNYAAHTIVLHMEDYSNVKFDLGIACSLAVILFFLSVGGNYILKLMISRVGK